MMRGFKEFKGKEPWQLLPWQQLRDVVLVLRYGAEKYEPDNWKRVPNAREHYFGAAMRHLVARIGGEMLDRETGLPHVAHATCNLLFIAWFDWSEGLRSDPTTAAPDCVIPSYARDIAVVDGQWERIPGRVSIKHTTTGVVLVPGEPGYEEARLVAVGWVDNSHVPG